MEPAQRTSSTSKNNHYPYIRTPHSIRSGIGKPLRPTAIEKLYKYAGAGNIQALEEMCEEYGNLDEPFEGFTAIYHATSAGNVESVKFFTFGGAHMTRLFPASDQEDQSDNILDIPVVESLLDVAIKQGHRDLALFLAQFIPLWFVNGRGELPLCNALRYNRPDLAFALIRNNSSYSTYLAVQESTIEAETVLSCARRLGHHDIADYVEIALKLPGSLTSDEPSRAVSTALKERGLFTFRWVVLPSLCVLTIGALYIIKTQAPKPFLESLVQLPLLYRGQHSG